MDPVDDSEMWRSHGTCVANCCRGRGQHRLHAAVVRFTREQEVRMLEAYTVDEPPRSHGASTFFGSRSLYERVGFTEVVRRSPTGETHAPSAFARLTAAVSRPAYSTFRLLAVRVCASVSGSSIPNEMIRFGWTLMSGPRSVVSVSATPRISRHLTRHGWTETRSSTTNAARPLAVMLRNFWLLAKLYPLMSMVDVAGL